MFASLAFGQNEPIAAKVTVNAEKINREVPPLWLGHNMEWVWGGQGLFKTDGSGPVDGLVPLLAGLKPGLIRYPGGSLANTFRWTHSIGPLSQRKPVTNFFVKKGEIPLLGFDDFMKFVDQVGAKGAIVIVNCTTWPKNPKNSGTAQEAAGWVAYANARLGDAPVIIGNDWHDSQYWAALRAKNGHPEPYRVTHWEIGNEVYDAGQGAGLTAAAYAARVTEYARLMKSVDPTIQIGTVLAPDQTAWNKTAIKGAAEAKGLVDFLIVHDYAGGAVATQSIPMWSNGTNTVPIHIEKAGNYDIILEAAGQPARGVYLLMRMELDGVNLGTVTVDADKHQGKRKQFKFTKELPTGTHTFATSFLNDENLPPEDRNLFLEALYVQPAGSAKRRLSFSSPEEMMRNLAASAELLKSRYLAEVTTLQKSQGTKFPCVMTEYGVMYGQSTDELKKCRDLKGALASARLAQIALEDERLAGSNFWCVKSAWFLVVEQGPLGWRYSPSGLALSALAPLATGKVVAAKIDCPMINAVAVRDGKTLALNFISWHPSRTANLEVEIVGLTGKTWNARILRVGGPGPDVQNEDGKAAVVAMKEERTSVGKVFNVQLSPCSITTVLLKLE